MVDLDVLEVALAAFDSQLEHELDWGLVVAVVEIAVEIAVVVAVVAVVVYRVTMIVHFLMVSKSFSFYAHLI